MISLRLQRPAKNIRSASLHIETQFPLLGSQNPRMLGGVWLIALNKVRILAWKTHQQALLSHGGAFYGHPRGEPAERSGVAKRKPRWGTGLSSARRPVRRGLGGGRAGPPPQRRAAELVAQIAAIGRGWACRHEHPDQGRRLTSPIRAEPGKPAASTDGPAVGFDERVCSPVTRVIRLPTRLRDGPAFFTALFTLGDARRS